MWNAEDCLTCIPQILPANVDAEKIYMIVQDQYIMSMGGAVAVNQMAIHAAMDLYEIENRVACFEKVLMLCRKILSDDKGRMLDKKGKK